MNLFAGLIFARTENNRKTTLVLLRQDAGFFGCKPDDESYCILKLLLS
ncbi:MAG: hypothetical protein LBG96_10030 [Tannerella sp.]|jgi:hypothetical protein|nr:hypothetical protein [Tannerella sp.]